MRQTESEHFVGPFQTNATNDPVSTPRTNNPPRPRYALVACWHPNAPIQHYDIEDATLPTPSYGYRKIATAMTFEHARLIVEALNRHNETILQ